MDHEKPIHYQLLLNYCWGHRESTLLLCPYGLLTSHINHDFTNPNTKIVWATDDQMAHPEWKQKSIDKWGKSETAGLSFNFIALRDIQRGEEITIDYGQEWEVAWNEHAQNFGVCEQTETETETTIATSSSNNNNNNNVLPAYELNKLLGLKLQTLEEGDYEKQGLDLFCREPYLEWSGVWRNNEDGNGQLKQKKEYEDWYGHNIFPCRIRKRRTTTTTTPITTRADNSTTTTTTTTLYLAELVERSPESKEVVVWGALFDVPRAAFYFKDQSYSRHHHQSWSFRHDMRIPDNLFPDVWKNKKDRPKASSN